MKLLEIIKEKFDKIYELELKSKDFIRPQSVKEAFHIRHSTAIKMLDLAEDLGYIRKRFNVLSPVDKTVVAYYYQKNEIPDVVYDEEYDDDENFAFLKEKHENDFIEIVYEYVTRE